MAWILIIIFTSIIVFYSTFNINIYEFTLIICLLLMMITYLGFFEEKKECYENEDTQDVNDNEKATEATATTTTSTTATTAGNCIDSSFVENITSIPSKVQSIIEPAIQALIDSVKNGNDDEDNIEDQDLFRPQKYIDEKDEYVGKVEEKENTDVMGNRTLYRKRESRKRGFKDIYFQII